MRILQDGHQLLVTQLVQLGQLASSILVLFIFVLALLSAGFGAFSALAPGFFAQRGFCCGLDWVGGGLGGRLLGSCARGFFQHREVVIDDLSINLHLLLLLFLLLWAPRPAQQLLLLLLQGLQLHELRLLPLPRPVLLLPDHALVLSDQLDLLLLVQTVQDMLPLGILDYLPDVEGLVLNNFLLLFQGPFGLFGAALEGAVDGNGGLLLWGLPGFGCWRALLQRRFGGGCAFLQFALLQNDDLLQSGGVYILTL